MDDRLRALAERIEKSSDNQVESTWEFDPTIRAWREDFVRRFGYAPSLNDLGYNYRLAIQSGARPDQTGHWPQYAVIPPLRERVQLKVQDHPTAWKGPVYDVTGTEPAEMTEEQWQEAESKGVLSDLIAALAREVGPQRSMRRSTPTP
jgi:hypothetical protein